MPTRFVILATPRCGSNWLCSLLDSHPEILCHHELFNPDGVHLSRSLRNQPDLLSNLQALPPLSLLAQAWSRSKGFKAVGFKLNLGQSEMIFNEVLNDHGVRKIIISRRNRIRSFVSEMNAEKTGVWESFPESTPMPHPGPLHVDKAELIQRTQRNQDYYRGLRDLLDQTDQPVLELEYETLDKAEQQQRMLNYLEVNPQQALVTATSRMNRGSLRSLISNDKELEQQLAGTELQQDLSEGGIE